MKYRQIFLLSITGLLVLAGCRKRVSKPTEYEARRYDLPVLLDALPVSAARGNTLVPSYKSARGISELINWYMHEMERFGWRLLSVSDDSQARASQALCVFEKPTSICVITLRQAGSRTVVYTDIMSRRTACD